MRDARQAIDFALAWQTACLDEIAGAGDEAIARCRAEADLAAEFVARMACARSVREIATAWRDCAGHRAETLRRDSERLLRSGQRICERLAAGTPPAPRS